MKNNYMKHHFPLHTFQDNEDIPFDKFAVWYSQETTIEDFKLALQDHFHIIQRDTDFLEIVPLPYSKASGIQYIIDHLGYTIEDTISIGDSTNDLPMLKYTHDSVAMGNSNPQLFSKVSYITTDINNDGILNALKHFHII